MATISIGTDRLGYTGRLAPVMPITDLIERFLKAEPRAEEAKHLAWAMLSCAERAEGHFALLRDEDAIHTLIMHPDPATARAYHTRLTTKYGLLLAEHTTEWETDPGEPDGEDPATNAVLPRHRHAALTIG